MEAFVLLINVLSTRQRNQVVLQLGLNWTKLDAVSPNPAKPIKEAKVQEQNCLIMFCVLLFLFSHRTFGTLISDLDYMMYHGILCTMHYFATLLSENNTCFNAYLLSN